ncbi:MAG: sigma-70 family RNA polymerase sigma factor [Bacilli bacterium]
MSNSLFRSNKEIVEVYNKYVDKIYRICYLYMKNKDDTEDAVSTVFEKFIRANKIYENEEHLEAWLVLSASNHCKNSLKTWYRKNKNIDNEILPINDHTDETLNILLSLPKKYKIIIYMYYYEGYTSDEIATKLNINASTVRSYLRRGRELLKNILQKDDVYAK